MTSPDSKSRSKRTGRPNGRAAATAKGGAQPDQVSSVTRPTASDEPAAQERTIERLPKELGVMLVTAGALGVVLPGPGIPVMVAGGLILWPAGFRKADGWLRSRYPGAHRTGMAHITRFLSDLERRYPGSTDQS
jgi:hypothetical protein